MSEHTLARLYRRVQMLLAIGRVTAPAADGGNAQTLQLALSGLETRDATPRLAEYGFASNPPVGSDAVVLCVAGDRSNAVVIATGNQKLRLKGLAPGDSAIYDSRGARIWLTPQGIVIDGAGLPMRITNLPKVRMETDLEVTGDIKDRCDTNGRTMANEREIYDTHTHHVLNVQTGDGTVVTQMPDQQE